MNYILTSHFLEDFLTHGEGKNVEKIYIEEENILFQPECITRNGSAEEFQFYVQSEENKQQLMEVLGVTKIESIESLQQKIQEIELKNTDQDHRLQVLESKHDEQLTGILTLQKNEDGIVGIHIPDVLKIDNLSSENAGTDGNLCLENPFASVFRVKEETHPSFIIVSGQPPTDDQGVQYTVVEEVGKIFATLNLFPKTIENYVLKKDTKIISSGSRIIGLINNVAVGAASGCSSLQIEDLPNSIESIGNSAFAGCTSLILHSLPTSLISIGISAFHQCSSLGEIDIRDCKKLSYIGTGAFQGAVGNIIMTAGQVEFFKERLTIIPGGYQLDNLTVTIQEQEE